MRFKEAIEHILPGTYREGLQALAGLDRERIACKNPRKLAGSLYLDEALAETQPNDPRWDYGIALRGKQTDDVVWVEVHPASSSNVKEVIAKLRWLKQWLRDSGKDLAQMTRKDGYHWVASGAVAIPKNSKQARQLAAAGLAYPRQRLSL